MAYKKKHNPHGNGYGKGRHPVPGPSASSKVGNQPKTTTAKSTHGKTVTIRRRSYRSP